MKKKTKDDLVGIGAMVLTVGTSTLVGWMAGWGAVSLVNHVFADGLTKGQLKLFGAVTTIGGVGLSLAVADEAFPKFTGIMQDIMDIFPTEPKEVPKNG